MIPNVVLIGVTGYGAAHFQELMRLHQEGKVRLIGATVINPTDAADACAALQEIDCPIFPDYREMLEATRGQAQLCAIPTAISWHSVMTLDALQAGCHVLVEKPLAGTLAEVDAMIEASRQAERFVAVGFQHLYHPLTLRIKEWVLAGAIGELRAARTLTVWPRPASYYARNHWAGRLHDGHGWVYDSPANNAMAHYLNLALFFAGPTRETSATPTAVTADLWRANPIESFDTAAAHFATAENVEIGFYGTHAAERVQQPLIRLDGTEGFITWEQSGNCVLKSAQGVVEQLNTGNIESEYRTYMFGLVTQRVTDPSAWVCTPQIARAHNQCIALLHQGPAIVNVSSARVARLPRDGGDSLMVIDGIADDLAQCFAAGKLLRDPSLRSG